MNTANRWWRWKDEEAIVHDMTWQKWYQEHILPTLGKLMIPAQGIDRGYPALNAVVHEGAWSVWCPFCQGGELAWEEGYFLCSSCWNGKAKHRILKSRFPNERKEIEKLLIIRPFKSRAWNPPETIEDIQRENEEHADELLMEVSDGLVNS